MIRRPPRSTPLSLHDALPIYVTPIHRNSSNGMPGVETSPIGSGSPPTDRKSTRLNSSHSQISYAVFCLKKKKKTNHDPQTRHVDHQRDRALDRRLIN